MSGNIVVGDAIQPDSWRLLRGRKAFAATAGNGAQGAVALADVVGDAIQPDSWRLLRGRKAFAATAGNGAQGPWRSLT